MSTSYGGNRGSGASAASSMASRPHGIYEDRPLTTDYDDALEEQRSEALSNDRERGNEITPEEPLGFYARMMPKTREGRLGCTVILILIVVGVCITAVFLTVGRPNKIDSSLRSSTTVPTMTPTRKSSVGQPTGDDRFPPTNTPSLLNSKSSSPSVTASPTSVPTVTGTESPTTQDRDQRYRVVADKFIEEGVSATDDFYPPSGSPTPQTVALSWLLDDDPFKLLVAGASTPVAVVVQRFVALVLFFETGGFQWIKADNWRTGTHECDWYGFQCSDLTIPNNPIFPNDTSSEFQTTIDGRAVISIQLDKNNLVGRFPAEIGFFLSCTTIGLWGNALNGILPTTLGNILPLNKLWLDDNELTGVIPTEFGQLRNLNDLTIYSNQLSGSIPSEIGNLTRLERFWANGMKLTGTVPTQLGNCRSLVNLYLDVNQLSGSLPSELGQLTNIRDMRFFRNQLVGVLPTAIFSLPNLKIAYLDTNSFQGSLPGEIGNMLSIEDFQAFSNRITGEIPPEVVKLTMLKVLRIEDNDLTGTIPNLIGNEGRILRLSLSGNRIGGTIPESLRQSTAIRRLQLDRNNFVGTLPTWLGSMTHLSSLNLQVNRFEGSIPQELGNLTLIEDLTLESNDLTGIVPTGLCTLGGLLTLTSDCAGSKPEVKCQCCTTCGAG